MTWRINSRARALPSPKIPLRPLLFSPCTARKQKPARAETTRNDTNPVKTKHEQESKVTSRSGKGIDRMVFSSAWLAAAARVPAELCQGPPRPGQRRRLRADEVLRALFLPPVRGLGRLVDCLVIFFCLPLPEYYVVPVSGRGGWAARPPGVVLYSYRRSLSVSSSTSSSSWMSSSEEGLYYSDD